MKRPDRALRSVAVKVFDRSHALLFARRKIAARKQFEHHLQQQLDALVKSALADMEALNITSLTDGTLFTTLRKNLNAIEAANGNRLRAARIARKKISPAKRQRVYRRDGHRCVLCGWGGHEHKGGQRSLTIGHIIPVADGGTDAEENLRTECSKCNGEQAREAPLPPPSTLSSETMGRS